MNVLRRIERLENAQQDDQQDTHSPDVARIKAKLLADLERIAEAGDFIPMTPGEEKEWVSDLRAEMAIESDPVRCDIMLDLIRVFDKEAER